MVTRRLVVRFVFTLALAVAMLGPAAAQQADRFYIFGQVKHPGAYATKPDMTVGGAIDVAGGFTEAASGVEIIRIVDGEKQVLSASLNDPVIGDDTIVVKR